ncbi:MAG: hypothetical protein AB7D39_06225 [Pseudodesulfovibrio sp.]|uniref:hypothetical protein n=1 Tax=Pseudodesulfovibrio sp. TaxID=2035812 RepID=UPI003D14D6C1
MIVLLSGMSALAASDQGIPLSEALQWQFPEPKHEVARVDMPYAEGVKQITGPKRGNIVRLTGPAELTKGDTEYVLEADVVADETAFTVKGSHITLNLNGHKVTYNNVSGKGCGVVQNDWNAPRDFVLINGEIVQGKGGGSGDAYGKGANPVFILSIEPVQLAGLKITYRGDNLAGIFIYRSHAGDDIHHNEITDDGSVVRDRHSGVPVIRVNGNGVVIRHNIIRGARQIGIRSEQKADIHHNEVHIASVVTNSSGIVGYGSIHNNKIIGRGVHPIGIWPGTGTQVYSNYVDVQNTKPGGEFGSTGAACVRFGWGKTYNVDIEDNLFIVHAEKDLFKNEYVLNKDPDSWGRALFVGVGEGKAALVKNNIIIGINKGNGAKAAAVGLVFNNKTPDFVFEGNLIASNWGCVLLSDLYGRSEGYPLFEGNTIARLEGGKGYHTIRGQYATYPSTARFLNNTFIGGASREDVDCDTSGAAVQEIVYCRRVVLGSSPAKGGDGQYVVSVVDQLGKALWSANGQLGTDLSVVIPDSLYTNRSSKSLGGSMERKRPGDWGLQVKYMDKVLDLPLPAEGVNKVDLPL